MVLTISPKQSHLRDINSAPERRRSYFINKSPCPLARALRVPAFLADNLVEHFNFLHQQRVKWRMNAISARTRNITVMAAMVHAFPPGRVKRSTGTPLCFSKGRPVLKRFTCAPLGSVVDRPVLKRSNDALLCNNVGRPLLKRFTGASVCSSDCRCVLQSFRGVSMCSSKDRPVLKRSAGVSLCSCGGRPVFFRFTGAPLCFSDRYRATAFHLRSIVFQQ